MKAIMVMFDSLNRHMLPPYGCDWVKAPNFNRLAERTVTFTNCYAGSLPCMPARREMHTGRYNFLHRSWGPLEPFDNSMPQLLKQRGVHSHLVTDHYHYWEENASTYHTKFSTWEGVRGQEGDSWKGDVADPDIPETLNNRDPERCRQDWINRAYMQNEEDHPLVQTIELGLEYINKNAQEDNWFLQLECFSPHEPFFSPEKYKELYPHEYNGPHFDWPDYKQVDESPELVEHIRNEYAAVISMCDHYLGKIIDAMDELHLWEDTMLIINTDHGFLLGEHGWWAKNIMPHYNEIAHIPLFIWDPRSKKQAIENDQLVQTIDIAPTILDYFNVEIPEEMIGVPLKDVICVDKTVREAALFGIHGGHVNCTNGRYVYMRAPVNKNQPFYNYTLLPLFGFRHTPVDMLQNLELAEPFDFTKGCKLLKIKNTMPHPEREHLLFDIRNDPKQERQLQDPEIESLMKHHIITLMKQNSAPYELYKRLGLESLLGSTDEI
ncbi:sulfatase [Gracilibacillus alcaliphilus]|uniref:sulfatase n=1 Tax=Gracilibacillus alcaliphilus TaxID=1401441 RepID=UPI00195E7C6F|nr:sulfatase [Gracilibacillus alcaliphilus]MBM7678117.1 arylsulfatase A-like enzyme [Gracilibacillus alcaliphilus]